MNPRPKNEQRVASISENGNPAAVFRQSGGESPLKKAGELAAHEKFCKTDFTGGTIVDYAHGSGFGIECRRKMIGTFSVEGDRLTLASDTGLVLEHDDVNQLRVEERDGVFRVSGPYFPDCAIAPAGVEIPIRETFVEAIDDSIRLLSEGMGRARGKTEEGAGPMEKFRATDFAEGTLVVYIDGFNTEFSRGRVTRFSIDGDRLLVITDGKAMLSCTDLRELKIEERGGVFLIYGNYCSCFALAPKGVEIGKRPTLDELEDAKEVLAGRRE